MRRNYSGYLLSLARCYSYSPKFYSPALGVLLKIVRTELRTISTLPLACKREAEAAELSYEQSLKDARAKAHNVAETTRDSVNAEIETEMEAAELDFAKQMESAELKIRKTREKALANVDAIAADTAKSLVEKLFAGKITLAAAGKAVKASN